MKLTRRDFLKAGAATLIVVMGGAAFRAVDQGVFSVGQGVAYEPWTNWRHASTAPERIVAAAILASNPHNSQPWLFRLSPETIDLFAVPERQIGVIDPFRREMYLGLGCALENMHLAAAAEGFTANIHLLPDPTSETHAARLSLIPAPTPTGAGAALALYEAIPHRHTNRAAYDTTRPVADAVFTALNDLISEEAVRLFWYRDDLARQTFGEVAIAAASALIADEQQSLDSHPWWRQDWDHLQATADGVTLDAQGLGGFVTGVAKFLPDLSRQQGDETFVQNLRETMIPTAAAFGILAVPDGLNNEQRLNCGRVWQRLHLWATTQGLAMQPLNQMCERVDREQQLGLAPTMGEVVKALVGDEAWHAIMPFRLGYPTQNALPSPRRGLALVSETIPTPHGG